MSRAMDDPQTRRRIDRVTAEDYLDDLGQRTPAEVRAMRDECREEEARLSYARRLLHGQLDVARAELERRGSGGDASTLVTALGDILADRADAPAGRSAANTTIYTPDGPQGRRRGDRVLDDVPLGRLPDLDDAQLVDVVRRLTEEEQAISRLRRAVLDHLDRLQQELITRYREGATSVDEVVPPAG
jgi:hypothetical protein